MEFTEIDEVDAEDAVPLLRELAVAIRTGNRQEADHQLDKLADLFGPDAQHEVSLGRYGPVGHGAG